MLVKKNVCTTIMLILGAVVFLISSSLIENVGFFAQAQTVQSDALLLNNNGIISQDEFLERQQELANNAQMHLENLKNQLENDTYDSSLLNDIRIKAEDIKNQIITAALKFRAPLNDINLRLDQISEPDEGNVDAVSVDDERSRLRQEKNQINVLVAQLDTSYLTANRLIENSMMLSRQLFTQTLTHRVHFSFALGEQIKIFAKEAMHDFNALIISWWQFIYNFKMIELFVSILIPFLLTTLITYFSHRMMRNLRQTIILEEDNIPFLKRLSLVFLSTLIPTLICAFFVFSIFGMSNYFKLFWPELRHVFRTISHQIVFVFFIARMSYVILISKNPDIRLLNVAHRPAVLLVFLLSLLAFVMAADYVMDAIYHAVSAPTHLVIVKSFVSVFLVCIIIFAISFIKVRHPKTDEDLMTSWPFYIRIPLILFGLIPIVIAFLGYIGLARFIVQQIVISGAFLVLMYLGFQTARAIASEGAFSQTIIGRNIAKRFNVKDGTMDQLGLFTAIFLYFIVLALCIPPIVMQFGFTSHDINNAFKHFLTGFQIGNVSISLIAILTGIVFFLVSWFLVRFFVRWLDNSVLARGKVDSGLRNSISTIIGYCGLALSAVIGLSAAGFNLGSVALIAGGLSLGIGFGLQNIVQNFVSGLILLAERPFKVGDYVETGTVSGIVKRISVRATEVETFKHETMIVPNSSLINNNVGNWTHRNKIGRVDIPLTVPAMIDPQHVVDVLMEIASNVEGVLKNPAPWVNFSSFDSNSLNFSLSVYLPDITATTSATNALRFAIQKRFLDEGIL
ncbi:mechanosensitive ion channel family protein [Bartonella tamiae]|uniref:mechanosensitive ion channel family protein n=1 Tax=Bartonella tamiae TaxID=373638 RepID=UPI001FD8760F|nr:mechanosensitive ion channel domain-containing protein [Bartonella tamiae]